MTSSGRAFQNSQQPACVPSESEAEVRASRALFEGIVEIAEDAIIAVDSNQCIILYNRGAEKTFGYVQTEVIKRPISLLLPQWTASANRNDLEEFRASPDRSRTVEQHRDVYGLRKDGTEFPAEASTTKLELGNDIVYTIFLRDITDRKQAAEALLASENFARGQVAVLKSTLDALAKESAADRLLGHMLRTITEQFGAHSSSVWRRDEPTGMIGFEFTFEDGRVVPKTDPRFAGMDLWLPMEDFWPWPEVFRTGKLSVIEDIRTVPPFALRDRLLPLGIVTVLLVPMFIAGRLEGAIGLRFTEKRLFRAEEIELAQALANQATLAMHLIRLSAESRDAAIIAERNRMARDIHDTLAQGFTGVIVQLEAAADATSKGLAKEADEHLRRAADLARESLKEARRSVQALRPLALQDKDLCEALDNLTRKMTAGTPLRAKFLLQGQPRTLSAEWEDNLLHIEQEVLTNALRHARATEFIAELIFGPSDVHLQLRDNGRGFDPGIRHDGFGLIGIRERVEAMGGQLTIQSAIDKGTRVLIILPLAKSP
jgi:PAS domain S-box-containing protein